MQSSVVAKVKKFLFWSLVFSAAIMVIEFIILKASGLL